MHRNDWMLKWTRTLAYFLMGAAGVFLLMSPLLSDVFNTLAVVMAWFLVVGGMFSTWGSFSERWAGEYIGIPPLASSFAVFGVLTFSGNYEYAPWIASANLALLLSVSIGLLARWREVRTVYRLAVHLTEKEPIR